jgi:hypothetical protein
MPKALMTALVCLTRYPCHPNIEGEIELIEEEDDNIYIEPNQPKDHIEHEGM